jgi:hypothetical protein
MSDSNTDVLGPDYAAACVHRHDAAVDACDATNSEAAALWRSCTSDVDADADADAELNGGRVADIASTMGAPRAFDLLGAPVPLDWDNPAAVTRRVERLVEAAHAAAEQMVELVLCLPQERASGCDLMREGGSVMTATDALIALHRALINYKNGALRFDGEDIVRDSLNRNYGAGVALLVVESLTQVRQFIVREMRLHWERHMLDTRDDR